MVLSSTTLRGMYFLGWQKKSKLEKLDPWNVAYFLLLKQQRSKARRRQAANSLTQTGDNKSECQSLVKL